MSVLAIVITDVVGLIALFGIVQLTRRRLLTIELGVIWLIILGGLMVIVTILPLRRLWVSLSTAIFDSPPYMIALLLFLLAILLYISIAISVLQKRVREIGQFISLIQSEPNQGEEMNDVYYDQ